MGDLLRGCGRTKGQDASDLLRGCARAEGQDASALRVRVPGPAIPVPVVVPVRYLFCAAWHLRAFAL